MRLFPCFLSVISDLLYLPVSLTWFAIFVNLATVDTWPEIADNAKAHARGYMAIWPPYALRKRMAEVKENENRTTSGLPGTSAVIRSSSWKLSRQSLLVTFCQHLLLALLFIEDYSRSLAHTTLYITEARNPIFCISTRFWYAVAEDVNKKFQVPQSLEEKQRMMYYLTNFHLQCWFLSPANCLQTHFRVPQNQYEKQRYRM